MLAEANMTVMSSVDIMAALSKISSIVRTARMGTFGSIERVNSRIGPASAAGLLSVSIINATRVSAFRLTGRYIEPVGDSTSDTYCPVAATPTTSATRDPVGRLIRMRFPTGCGPKYLFANASFRTTTGGDVDVSDGRNPR